MTDVNTIASRYIDLWNERTPSRRPEILSQHWADDAKYVDPLMSGDGHGVDALIAGVQQRFADFRFQLIGQPNGLATTSVSRGDWAPKASTAPSKARISPSLRMDGSGASPDFSIRFRQALDAWEHDRPGEPGRSCRLRRCKPPVRRPAFGDFARLLY